MASTDEFLRRRVGGYLRNPTRVIGAGCAVCTTPLDVGTTCHRCEGDRSVFGAELADLVVPISYGGHNEQSRALLHGYKDLVAASSGDERRRIIVLLLWLVVHRHRVCLVERVGADVDLWSAVPSTRGRPTHPLAGLVRRAGLTRGECAAHVTPAQPSDLRSTMRGRFTLEGPSCSDRHVVIVDDTWTTGGRAQSLALTAREAGAAAVTIIVLARWLSPDWPPTRQYLERSPTADFDPALCPVYGTLCGR